MNDDEIQALAAEAQAVSASIQLPRDPNRSCAYSTCGRSFRYGDLIVQVGLAAEAKLVCKNCWIGKGGRGSVRLFLDAPTVSVVERDRAMRNMKKLTRMAKRTAKSKG